MARGAFRRARRCVPSVPVLLCGVLIASASEPPRPVPLKSGAEFAGADARAMQADGFGNPGMLWVARGESVWREPAGKEGKSCASCHQEAPVTMKGVAARYPAIDRGSARLVNLEGRYAAKETWRDGREYESEYIKDESGWTRNIMALMIIGVIFGIPALIFCSCVAFDKT